MHGKIEESLQTNKCKQTKNKDRQTGRYTDTNNIPLTRFFQLDWFLCLLRREGRGLATGAVRCWAKWRRLLFPTSHCAHNVFYLRNISINKSNTAPLKWTPQITLQTKRAPWKLILNCVNERMANFEYCPKRIHHHIRLSLSFKMAFMLII